MPCRIIALSEGWLARTAREAVLLHNEPVFFVLVNAL